MKDKLKKLIQEAVPSIVELKFGSYVTGMGYHNSKVVMIFSGKIHLNKGDYVIEKELRHEIEKKCTWENSIQLADVLIAIWNINKSNKDVIEIITVLCGSHPTKSWSLKKDLDGQSDDTIEFLYNLLK